MSAKSSDVNGGFLLATIVAVPLFVSWRGYALSVMWKWFAVPLGVPAIGVAHAIGLAAIVAMMAKSYEDNAENERSGNEKLARAWAIGLLGPLFALIFGWIVKGFM